MKKIKFYISILIMAVITFSISCEKEKEELDDNPTTEEKTFGLQETPASELAQIPIASQMTYTGSFPNQFYLETPPPEEDGQGSEGSCVGWAVAYGMKSYHLQESYYDINGDFNYSSVCSPEYVYNQIKVGDCGSGAQFAPAFELLKNQGVCSWDIMPYSDNNGCSTMPNATQTENANQHKILSYQRITDLSEQNLKILLLNKYPIVIGARLDDHFMQADEDFIWQAPFGVLRGLHAMVICGYDDNKQAFKIINSWGRDFGDDGYVWCDYDFLSEVVFEAYITEPDENNNNNGTLPTVSTNNISDITENSAVSGGNISSDGGSSITVKGVCWSVNQNPTVSDSKTTDGAGINSYTSSITNLSVNTTYYVRAYATNQNGTAYGDQKTFTTTGNNTGTLIAHYEFNGNTNDLTGNNIVSILNLNDLITTDTYLSLKKTFDGDPQRKFEFSLTNSNYKKIELISRAYYIHNGNYTMSGFGYTLNNDRLGLTHNDYHYSGSNEVGQYDLRENIYLIFSQYDNSGNVINWSHSDLLSLVENEWITEKVTIDYENNTISYTLETASNTYNLNLSNIDIALSTDGVFMYSAWDWSHGSEQRIDNLKIYGYN